MPSWRSDRQAGRPVLLGRCGGRGFASFRRAYPAASDLVGIYEDVGNKAGWRIERPLVSIRNLCIRWGGDRRYPNTTGCNPFERKIDRKSTRLNSSHRCISYAV